ncbi:MAG TPA: 1,4-alpha-glucan branching protein domain-containing protein [Thermomicrobiales bacterium]|jgi:1,4-alpha-glucan branching enzyme|nr:1,4-alpha-glucan branching protein domain-containing protein [Thermomicrobiales bacterium]
MAKHGAFTFVLHSHLPYARESGMWPHGEEWVHEAIAETYLPLLNALYDLEEEGVPYRLTVGITPILGEQLADALIAEHFIVYAAERAAWAAADIPRFEEAGDDQMVGLARYYNQWYARALSSFTDRFGKDIIGAFKGLQDRGRIEISTSAATHGYLPLVSRDSTIYGQLETGVNSYRRMFGRDPKAIWLPECAYRPAVMDTTDPDHPVRRPGIESFLETEGLQVFFSETHLVEGGRPVGRAAGDAIGAYGMVTQRYSVPLGPDEQREPGTTYQPYWVGDAPGTVAVLARNNRTSQQVWSGDFGYPGDAIYREFHRKDAVSGMQYWSISGPGVDLGQKEPYDPWGAQERTRDHARHFVGLVEELLGQYYAEAGKPGVIASNYDTELFGHWWYEGVDWLKEVLRGLAHSDTVELTTASGIIEDYGPEKVMDVPEGSWGANGTHFTWMNVDTEWMWPIIHGAERRMEQLVATYPDADGELLDVLSQTARELLLLESSDWPFLVTTGQAKEYATERFQGHVEHFDRLAEMAESGANLTDEDRQYLEALKEKDNPFPVIDYRVFAARQGSAAPAAKIATAAN